MRDDEHGVMTYCDVCGGPHDHNHTLGRLAWALRTARHAEPRTLAARVRLWWHDFVLHGLLDRGTERCQDCGRDYEHWWCDDQAAWDRVMGGPTGLLCRHCFLSHNARPLDRRTDPRTRTHLRPPADRPTRRQVMTRYRKKPVVIEAIRNDGEWSTIIGWLDIIAGGRITIPFNRVPPVTRNPDGSLNIATLEGTMRCDVDDWIIRGVQGELYPCKPDIFAATADLLNDADQGDTA